MAWLTQAWAGCPVVREVWEERSGSEDPLTVEAVFPEAVLEHVVGGPRVMKAQLLHPDGGEDSGRSADSSDVSRDGRSFTWLSFRAASTTTLCTPKTFRPCDYVENRAQIGQVAKRFTRLSQMALNENEGEALELIAQLEAGL